MAHSAHRSEGIKTRGDFHLPRIAQDLRRMLLRMQRDCAFDSLWLDAGHVGDLASVLVDFAEDIHNDIGMWAAYERYNIEYFGTPLPLTSGASTDRATGVHPDRIRHLLWILYPALIEEPVLAPFDEELQGVADATSVFLRSAFASVPRDSGAKTFLHSPNEYGWDVKRKLVWTGTHSYMFRLFFANYLDEHNASERDISYTDDFICQECTRWSGLGAIDILAGILDISDDDRRDLRSWYERHTASYKLRSVNNETLDATNLVSDQRYRIRINMQRHPFKEGQLVFGGLVPWRGEWYWSGEQRAWDDASAVDADDIKRTMKRQCSQIVCRYNKEYENQVRQRAAELHEAMMAHQGEDLVVYPDGLSMAADWQKELRYQWDSKDPAQVKEVIEKHGLKRGRPEMPIPKSLLEHKNGLGVFINPDEGREIMQDFATVISGLQRRGENLTDDEAHCIRSFLESPVISPRFVRRVLDEHGSESVKAAFLLHGEQPGYWLDYLLRSYKGQHYRRRYPSVSVI